MSLFTTASYTALSIELNSHFFNIVVVPFPLDNLQTDDFPVIDLYYEWAAFPSPTTFTTNK